jgi:hypothetical protein
MVPPSYTRAGIAPQSRLALYVAYGRRVTPAEEQLRMAGACGFSRGATVAAVAVGVTLTLPSVARAESVRSAVGQHLANELPERRDTDTTSETAPTPSTSGVSRNDRDAEDSEIEEPLETVADSHPPTAATPTPRRLTVLGRRATVDLSLRSRMQAWLPAQNPSVHVNAAPYRMYSLELSGGIEGLFTLHQLAFETDGSSWVGWSGPAAAPAAGTSGIGAAAALAMIGLPLLHARGPWAPEPIIRYELSTYATTATPSRPVCIVARDADTSADPVACTPTDSPLRMASRFESLVVGVQIGGQDGLPSMYGGIDVVRQRKPYQVNVDGRTLDDYLFDARFGGAGLALGFGFGSDQGFNARGGFHFGLAWISLTDDLSLEDELPSDWVLQYLRWDVGMGYGRVLVKGPPRLLVRAGLDASGTHFVYVRDADEDTPSLSRDIFFAGSLALTLQL